MVAESEGEDRATMQAEVQQLTAKRAGLEAEQERAAQERADERQGQIGTGDRSEKIRTYNIPQARITDHRIGLSVHNVEAVLGGELDEIVAALRQAEREARLADLDD